MAEYIEREAAVQKIGEYKGFFQDNPSSDHMILKMEAEDIIKDQEPADVAPVVHARWVHDHYEQLTQFEIVKCTNCDYEAYAMAVFVGEGNYCPNCGAKMDLEK